VAGVAGATTLDLTTESTEVRTTQGGEATDNAGEAISAASVPYVISVGRRLALRC
jgi:hypothetical protein